MKKIVRLTESDLVRIVKKVISESEGDTNNPNWVSIKQQLIKRGFKLFKTTKKVSGVKNLVSYGNIQDKIYKREFLDKDNLVIQYPYFKTTEGPLDYSRVGIVLSREKVFTPTFINDLVNDFNIKDYDYKNAIPMKVSDVNSIINLVGRLSKY
jgi:hypothetical protein